MLCLTRQSVTANFAQRIANLVSRVREAPKFKSLNEYRGRNSAVDSFESAARFLLGAWASRPQTFLVFRVLTNGYSSFRGQCGRDARAPSAASFNLLVRTATLASSSSSIYETRFTIQDQCLHQTSIQ